MTTRTAALALIPLLAGGPAFAATCHMTVQGVPVIDDQDCTAAGPRGNVRVADAAGDVVRIRRSTMSGRFIVRRRGDPRLHRIAVSYGQIVASDDSDDKTCYFNQKATLCIDP